MHPELNGECIEGVRESETGKEILGGEVVDANPTLSHKFAYNTSGHM